jgi:hypothetical protein
MAKLEPERQDDPLREKPAINEICAQTLLSKGSVDQRLAPGTRR